MNTLRIIIKSLYKRKLSVFLIGIQIALSIWFFISIACNIQKFIFGDLLVKSHLNYNSDKVIHIKLNPDTATPEKFLLFREEAIKQKEISFIGSYRTNKSISVDSEKKIEAITKLQNNLINKGNIDMLSGDRISVIYMERGINSLVNMKVDEGRNFIDDDFKSVMKLPTPVLAGYKLIKYNVFNLGEEIEDKQNSKLYKIVGVLSNDSSWFRYSPEQGEFINMDDKLIIPFNDSMYSELLPGMMITNYYSVLNGTRTSSEIIFELNKVANTIGLQVEMNSLKEELDMQRDKIITENSMWIFFSLFFIVMTTLSLLFIMSTSIVARKKEFGIRIAVGASILEIQKLVIGEILVIVLTASAFAIIYSIYSINFNSSRWYDSILNSYYISPRIILVSMILAATIATMPAIATSYKFKKIQPNELIGGDM